MAMADAGREAKSHRSAQRAHFALVGMIAIRKALE